MSTTAPITTPFGATSTAAEVIAGVDLSGKQAIVTGAASGIGVETARALASAGATVTLAVRNVEAGETTRAQIAAELPQASLRVSPLDLADPASVAAFVGAWDGPRPITLGISSSRRDCTVHSRQPAWRA
jgi:NAD(P)-dependent dehydrogenase (short-subunit alcohol dehydrogenase family)